MYRTIMTAVFVLDFLADLAYKASLKLQEVDDYLGDKAEALEDKAIEARLDANEARFNAAFEALEQAKGSYAAQVQAYHAEMTAIQAAHG